MRSSQHYSHGKTKQYSFEYKTATCKIESTLAELAIVAWQRNLTIAIWASCAALIEILHVCLVRMLHGVDYGNGLLALALI